MHPHPVLKRQKQVVYTAAQMYYVPSLCQIAKLVTLKALEILLLKKNVDALLDVTDLGGETGLDLLDSLGHELRVLHCLSRLHDSNDSRLWRLSVRLYGSRGANVVCLPA